jgi:hypothetical protein
MKTATKNLTRRRFLGVAASSVAFTTLGQLPHALAAAPSQPHRKTILSFYCDDTKPSPGGAKGFQTFLDYCAEQGIKGEASCILAMGGGGSISRTANDVDRAYLEQVRRAWKCGLGSHMEIMTHSGLFDFAANSAPKDAQHEGVWLHEPAVTVEQYERYFSAIVSEGDSAQIRFSGFTWPGCGCEACTKRYKELRAAGHTAPDPALWQALLNLAKQGKFRGPTVPCFFDSSEKTGALHRKASEGEFGVYDLMPNAGDKLATYRNSADYVEADYYITEDGRSGIIVRHVEAGAPYCLFYAHWQGLNPADGRGWQAFTTVVARIRKHLAGRMVWMRPSEITERYHKAGGWGFLDTL